MRILLVHPGNTFSTADVYTGLKAGLEANGAEVIAFPLDHTLSVAFTLVKCTETLGAMDVLPDPHIIAAADISGMAMRHQVDAMIAVTGNNLPWGVPYTLGKGGIRTAIICTESPYMTDKREKHDARWYDEVFTNERMGVPLFTRNDPAHVHYLPHAYNPLIHTPGPVEEDKQVEAYFVGTGFEERQELFETAGLPIIVQGTMWDGKQDVETVMRRIAENEEVVRWYRSALICLNHHRTTGNYRDGSQIQPGDAESLGPRAYEIAACRGFQLSDDSRPELYEVFGDTVPTYRSNDSADLSAQVQYWLNRPDERERLAWAQWEAVQPHTWTARAARVLDVLSSRTTGRVFHQRVAVPQEAAV